MANIDHFVVLMLENRSFDHICGLRPGVAGVLDAHGNPAFSNTDLHGRKVLVGGDAPFSIPTKHGRGPFHNVIDVNEQLFSNKQAQGGPTLGGFVTSYREALTSDTHGQFTDRDVDIVMHGFSPLALPSINALADHFLLCDHWFCEVPGPTHPNRLYVHAGTSAGFAHNVFKRPFDLLTVYELLERNGQSWAVYDFDLNDARTFTRIADQTANFRRFSPRFAQDVETGRLPNYSFIMPRFLSTHSSPQNDQHAPADMRWGEHLIADVYDTLRANQVTWERSALIITYDEHGGFFDHVVPPAAVNPDGINSPRPDDNTGSQPPVFSFDRLGLRVPALIVSAWVASGHVVTEPLQHTSILKTVRERFGIQSALSHREAAARSFLNLFDQPRPRTDTPVKLPRPILPLLPPPDHHANPGNHVLDDLQLELLAGMFQATRLSHPEDEATPPRLPRTQAEAAAVTHQRWSRHARQLGA